MVPGYRIRAENGYRVTVWILREGKGIEGRPVLRLVPEINGGTECTGIDYSRPPVSVLSVRNIYKR
jgi:hypothetical protein